MSLQSRKGVNYWREGGVTDGDELMFSPVPVSSLPLLLRLQRLPDSVKGETLISLTQAPGVASKGKTRK